MPRFVEEEVRKRAREPSESGDIVLLIGYDGRQETIERLMTQVGGEVLETLPFSTLTASVPETAIQRILEHPEIETVELDEGMETLQGN